MDILSFILFGALVGFIADLIDSKRSGGLFTNIIIGILGSFVGTWLITQFGPYLGLNTAIQTGFNLINIVSSVIGALIVLFFWRLIFNSR